MRIDVISPASTAARTVGGKSATDAAAAPFKSVLQEYVQSAQAENITTNAVLTGETDDLHSLMIDMEKTSLSLQLLVQVRNKILEAYTEIMRMQI